MNEMDASLTQKIEKIASIDLFKQDSATAKFKTGFFIGRPFHIDYDRAHILVSDAWKAEAKGIPQGSFLLAYYENESDQVLEALLLRVIKPIRLPSDSNDISSMIEYYEDNLKTSGKASKLDLHTRYHFSWSGLECRILGTFYNDFEGNMVFGADVENFYSPHHYSVIKPNAEVLKFIVNFRDGGIVDKPTDIKIGKVRYSSSRRFQEKEDEVAVNVSPADFLGKRTALFGMTRTGKSNTVKKIIEATVRMNMQSKLKFDEVNCQNSIINSESIIQGIPRYPVGQIIFDMNGEYANANLQDEGTAIFELFKDQTNRYSTIKKEGFKVMKANFYRDIQSGFELVRAHLLQGRDATYLQDFQAVQMVKPDEYDASYSIKTRYDRKVAAYQCCLYEAGFQPSAGFKVKFKGDKELNDLADGIDPQKGISLSQASKWFKTVWENYNKCDHIKDYPSKNEGREWADRDLKAMLAILTRKKNPNDTKLMDGYLRLRGLIKYHTETIDTSYDNAILDDLRNGRIVIIDLSQGDPSVQTTFSAKISEFVFRDSMNRFIANESNNFIQFYFEEAHNLFPKKENKDQSDIYSRLAKEGAKLNLGIIYATQEVSSISTNILKNTQNWFIAHLNNEDETREIKKYYDFEDFSESLVRFSSNSDKGFVRMKTYSNPFVVPVQIDRFPSN